MRATRWVLCVLAACAAAAAVLAALLLPVPGPSSGDVRAPMTVGGHTLGDSTARDVVERLRQAMADLMAGKTPDDTLGAGVVKQARAAIEPFVDGSGDITRSTLTLEPEGWRELNGAGFVTVGGTLEWSTRVGNDTVDSGSAMPMLLELTWGEGRWDVAFVQHLPDGGFYGSEEPQLAPWAQPWLVGLACGLAGLGALLLLCFPRLASGWRSAIVVPAVMIAGAILLLGSGAPSSADGGQIFSSYLDTLVERPIIRPGGWADVDANGFQAYADAVHTFFWLVAALLGALALAAAPPRRSPADDDPRQSVA
ncbi:hypothetical protein [Galactobacter valiniphilus]|nr:hypothetical protein [Galactobacter valiniphilus]